MALGTNLEAYRPMLQDYYSDEKALDRAIRKLPTLRLLRKSTDWKGRDVVRPVAYSKPQNIGSDIATVLADKANHRSRNAVWTFKPKDVYGAATIDRKTMKLSEGMSRAFLEHYTAEVDGTNEAMMRDLAINVFRSQAFVRTTVDGSHASTDLANGVIGLPSRYETALFEQGMDIVFSDAASPAGSSLHVPVSGRFTVDQIDGKLGTLTITNGVDGAAVDLAAAGVAASDFIHRRGNVTAASNTLGLIGFEDFILSAADRAALVASPVDFLGVDRTKHLDKLAGLNLQASGYSMQNALLEMLLYVAAAGVEITHCVMHPSRFAQLVREVEASVIRDDKDGSAKIGRRMIRIMLDSEEVSVYSDPFCQVNKIWGLNVNDLDLKSVGKLPQFLDDDLLMLRDAGADGYEVRLGGYGELLFGYPGTHIQVELV